MWTTTDDKKEAKKEGGRTVTLFFDGKFDYLKSRTV